MITIKGKHNFANVMIDCIDETTRAQILTFLNHPANADSYIAVMPDCHAGKGAVVGWSQLIGDVVVPNVVGVDIACGMLSVCIGDVEIDRVELDKWALAHIPTGFARNPDPMKMRRLAEQFVSENYDVED